MPANSPFDFRTTELDSTLLSTPFEVQTSWHVIEGAPSCGKTTLINLLPEKGCWTLPESGRSYIEDEIASGRTIGEIHRSGPALQRAIERMKRKVEGRPSVGDVAFLDGALPGSLAWYRLFGLTRMKFCWIACAIAMLLSLSSTGFLSSWTA